MMRSLKTALTSILLTVSFSCSLFIPGDALSIIDIDLVSYADYEYTVSNEQATITKYTGDDTSITIPSVLGGFHVVSIGRMAFYLTDIQSVTIPEGVTQIGPMAFCNCKYLKSVAFPSTLTTIDYSAFEDCCSLTSIALSKNLTEIGDYAFYGTSLTSVNIPASVDKMGKQPFAQCKSLGSVTVDPTNKFFNSEDGILYNENFTALILYPPAKADSTFTVKSGITEIGEAAFYGASNLTNVALPPSLKIIGPSSFFLTAIKSISVPSGVASVGYHAFGYNTNLTSAVFAGANTLLDNGVFCCCAFLSKVSLPSALKSISSNTFYECGSLTSVDIPNSVTSIGSKAFYGCINLNDIIIPSGVTSIDEGAFSNCTNLNKITIPSGVKSIGNEAFSSTSLTSVIIPASVTALGNSVFSHCNYLAEARFYGALPSLLSGLNDYSKKPWFSGCSASFKIYYLEGKSGWTTPTWNSYTTVPFSSIWGMPSITPPKTVSYINISKVTIDLDKIDFKQPETIIDIIVLPELNGTEDSSVPSSTILHFYQDKPKYTLNGIEQAMDASPVNTGGRIMLPIKYVTDSLGAGLSYNSTEKKVTVTLGSKTIELWIGSNKARIDGEYILIDNTNPEVVPFIQPPGRTMLPLRFIGEQLGFEVEWNAGLKMATLTYSS